MYNYILFDIDNTLLDYNKLEKAAMTSILQKYGLPPLLSKRLSEITDRLWKQVEKKEITPDNLKIKRFEILFNELNINDIDVEKISMEYLCEASKYTYEIPLSYDVCKKLFDMGKKLYVVTNGIAFVQRSKLSRASFFKFFEKVFISEEIGFYKPDKTFFDYVIDDICAKRENCIIIGDSLTSDILGGINSGIDTCWYNPMQNPSTKLITPTYTITSLYDVIDIVGDV